ncbi:ribonuclease H-like domain-containing protein [Tanacetum coccineum]
MLTMRVKRFIKKTGRKMYLNDKETVGFDRTNVECYNCHRRGHFAREYRAPRNQENINRDAPRRNALVDTSTTNALVVQDGIGGYDWSFQAKNGITNFSLMAYTSQGSLSSSSSDSEHVYLRVMSSPNHPTSDIEDAFSSNFLDYIPASPDYVPASPGNTYSSSSNNSFGLVPIASPTLLLFHDDPYMKGPRPDHPHTFYLPDQSAAFENRRKLLMISLNNNNGGDKQQREEEEVKNER